MPSTRRAFAEIVSCFPEPQPFDFRTRSHRPIHHPNARKNGARWGPRIRAGCWRCGMKFSSKWQQIKEEVLIPFAWAWTTIVGALYLAMVVLG